jgi:uncharacterized protein YjcR
MSRQKRHRGGQPGNQNARKHGFFSSAMSPQELCEFWQNLKTGGDSDRELVVFRTRLFSALRASPGNRRIIQESARLMTKWVCSKDANASREDKADAAKVIRFVCSQLGELSSQTNESMTPETAENFTERIVAEMEKWL